MLRSAAAAIAVLISLTGSPRAGDAWSDPENPIRTLFKGKRLDLWSLRPPRAGEPPAVSGAHSVPAPVDRFLLARLEKDGLAFSPEADRRTLARRLAYVLTGLPPREETLRDFLADHSPDAYERLVDELLDSPDYGAQQARWWLDTARYSDSNGYDWDEFRPSAWRYRDYVVRSFQGDKPFDLFIREQIAGDEMSAVPAADEAARDALLATGFLRMGPRDNSAKLFGEEHRARAAVEADMAETTATAFLGMTLRCCRCHDHKTDPLSQEDHYRLRAFFSGVKWRDDLPVDMAPEYAAIQADQAERDGETGAAEKRLGELLNAARRRLSAEDGGKTPPGKIPEKKALAALTGEEKAEREKLRGEIQAARAARREFTTALGVEEDRAAPLETAVLAAGDADQPGQKVAPGVFTVFQPGPSALGSLGRREALAAWLTAPENPLTARVIVNRIWQQCFGEGLVRTPDDFGFSGSPPTHPELLDWLAADFRDHGWSVKRLMRRLVTSAAWRQDAWTGDPAERERAAAMDPDARLLWRSRPRRLTAEQLRDSLLHVAGWLTESPEGPPVWPELPPEVLQANPAFLDDNAEKTKGWYPSPPGALHVRSLRLVQKRSVKIPFMETFDLPDNFESCTRRQESTVAPQALTLLNHPFIAEVCAAAAERITAATPETAAARLEGAFRLILQRPPAPEEAGVCLPLLETRGLVELCRVLVNTSEFLTID